MQTDILSIYSSLINAIDIVDQFETDLDQYCENSNFPDSYNNDL